MALVLTTPPASEPVSLVEAKAQCRVEISDDDDLIEGLIRSARQWAERFTRRAFITQQWMYVRDDWPQDADWFRIPLPPLQSVESVQYQVADGTLYTLSASDYTVDTISEPGRIALADGASWPSDDLYPVNGVRVQFTAGYGNQGSNVPQPIRQAILLLVGHWYENREAVTVGAVAREVPFAVEALLWPYRVMDV